MARTGYQYLGGWMDQGGSNVEEKLLRQNLSARGYNDNLIGKALFEFDRAKALGGGHDLYQANKDAYELLRYGIQVSPEPGESKKTVDLIDWKNPDANHFAIAEEVTIVGRHTKRPDIVLYVNGIALGVLELKRSLISVTEGIRQNIGNQTSEFIQPFFSGPPGVPVGRKAPELA